MNPNADYLGIVTMLRSLREQGLVSAFLVVTRMTPFEAREP